MSLSMMMMSMTPILMLTMWTEVGVMGNKMGVAKTFGRGGGEQGDLIKHIHQHTDQTNSWKAENALLCRDAKSNWNSTDTNLSPEN